MKYSRSPYITLLQQIGLCLCVLPCWAEQNTVDPSLSFQRLFTSQEQRKILDQHEAPSENSTLSLNATATELLTQNVTLSGVVLRDDGKYTVWINGESSLSLTQNEFRSGKPRLNKNLNVAVGDGSKSVLMKPGQVWVRAQRQIKEAYEIAEENDAPALPLNITSEKNEDEQE